jgi:hypothetical protein
VTARAEAIQHSYGVVPAAREGRAHDLPNSLSEGLPQLRLKIDFERDMDWSFQRNLGIR